MKRTQLPALALLVLVLAACSSSKKSVTTTTAPTASEPTQRPATSESAPPPPLIAKPMNRRSAIREPAEAELTAIQAKYKEVTMQTLQEGYGLYTGVCTDCHNAKNVYHHTDENWKDIIADMGARARLSESQKDAVYKYVLAIRAVQ